jgi:hypothetical protein
MIRFSAPGMPPYRTSASSQLSINELKGIVNTRHIPTTESQPMIRVSTSAVAGKSVSHQFGRGKPAGGVERYRDNRDRLSNGEYIFGRPRGR